MAPSSIKNKIIVISDSDSGSATEAEDDEEDVLHAERERGGAKRRRVVGRATNSLEDRDEDMGVSGGPTQQSQQQLQQQASSSSQPQPSTLASLLGDPNERKQLERARRERQRQRRRAAGLPSDSSSSGSDGEGGRSGKAALPPVASSSKPAPAPVPAPTSAATSGLGTQHKPALRRILASDRFYQGTVKRSYNQYANDGGIFLSDVLLPTTKSNAAGLTHALIGSYIYDFEWLATFLPDRQSCSDAPSLNITFIAPQRSNQKFEEGAMYTFGPPGWGLVGIKDLQREYTCMHSKFMLLFYPDRLRLVILTGNLIEYDWKTLENAAYIQDFPLAAPGSQTACDGLTQLQQILKSLSIPNQHPAYSQLRRYDLSQAPFIVASAATHTSEAKKGWNDIAKWGLGRLSDGIRKLCPGLKGGRVAIDVEAQGSSMGSYSQRWLQQIHIIASGADISSVLPLPSSATAARKAYESAVRSSRSSKSPSSSWPPTKIIFPTRQFVESQSATGPSGGGCHFGKPAKFQPFKQLCHHATSTRHKGILMHQKGLLGLRSGSGSGSSTDRDCDEIVGWVYMGSANFTMNAWGNIAYPSGKTTSQSQPQLNANNWELGVLFPLRASDMQEKAQYTTLARSCICWQRPLVPYGENDEPWVSARVQREEMSEDDSALTKVMTLAAQSPDQMLAE